MSELERKLLSVLRGGEPGLRDALEKGFVRRVSKIELTDKGYARLRALRAKKG